MAATPTAPSAHPARPSAAPVLNDDGTPVPPPPDDTIKHGEVAAALRHRQIAGVVVPVKIGALVGLLSLGTSVGLLVCMAAGADYWAQVILAIVAVSLAAVGVGIGVWGVIRYGLFTEGMGVSEVEHELHLARYAYWAGVLSEVAILMTVILLVIQLARSIA